MLIKKKNYRIQIFTMVLAPRHLAFNYTHTCNGTIPKYLNYRKEGIKKITNKNIFLILEKILKQKVKGRIETEEFEVNLARNRFPSLLLQPVRNHRLRQTSTVLMEKLQWKQSGHGAIEKTQA